jgi:hypothetical protein
MPAVNKVVDTTYWIWDGPSNRGPGSEPVILVARSWRVGDIHGHAVLCAYLPVGESSPTDLTAQTMLMPEPEDFAEAIGSGRARLIGRESADHR